MAAALPAKIVNAVIATAKPNLATFLKYAKVELTPPSPGDFGEISRGIRSIINSARTGKWKQFTVREAFMNTLITTEVICWFYIGEVIGKRHVIGYDIKV